MRFFLTVIFSSFWGLQGNLLFAQNEEEYEERFPSGRARLCGPNSVYLAMKLLEKPEKYEVLMQNFPDSNDEGISLFQIRTFLEKKGVFCKTVRQSELEMSQLPTSILSFVLRESEEAPHIYLTRASRNGLQIMDRDSSHPFQLSTQFHGNKKYFCLLASTIPFPKENFFRLFLDKWGPYVPGLLFLVVLGSLIFKKRVKHEKV